MIGGTHHL